MENDYTGLVGKTCFYRNVRECKESTGIISAIEHRHNIIGEVSSSATMANGDSVCISALWFPGLPGQDL